MYIVRQPIRRPQANQSDLSDDLNKSSTSSSPMHVDEPPDIIALDHVSQKKPSRSNAEVFPTSPILPKKTLLGSSLTGTGMAELRTRNLTPEKLRNFLGGDRNMTMDEVSRTLSAYNKAHGGQKGLAGSFLTNTHGSPIGLNVGFDGSRRTSEARFCYNLDGDLEIRLNTRIHQGVSENFHLSWFNRSLSTQQIQDIESIARSVENDNHYSTLAVPLAFCRYSRLANKDDEPIDFQKTHEFFSSHASELIKSYKGGACFSLSELLRDQIRQKTGADAFVVTRLEDNSVVNWPSFDGPGTEVNEHAYKLLGSNTHTDVVVPYMKDGRKCYIHIAVGMGADFSTAGLCHINHWGHGPEDADIESFYLSKDQVIANPERLAAQGVRCKPKIFMKNPKTGAIFGLDLVKGYLYFNTRAQKTVTDKFQPEEAYEKTADYSDPTSFILGLSYAQNVFGLDREFSKDVLFLMENRQQFLKEVIIPPAYNFSKCQDVIEQTNALAKERDNLAGQVLKAQPNNTLGPSKGAALLLQAKTAVRESTPESARSLYTAAAESLEREIQSFRSLLEKLTH